MCPSCGSHSSRIHSSYLRFPADFPSAGRRVVLCLRVRRFFCRNASCGRQTFVEQLPGLTRRHSRWTDRLRSTLAAVGPRPRRPGRRPDGTSLRGVRQPQHGVAAAHGLTGAGGALPTGGRRR
ncbi:transposase family protein [Streptomyces sp. NPDC057376]|uniref:transposase family protein n=1 Tax=unclassified Streptomyces TaxID=2593676 RepID=UPI001F51702C|nr:transposase family protein [Streptomyces sp. CB02414]